MLFLVLILTFFITIIFFLKYNLKLARYLQIVDTPNYRKRHIKPTPLTGGFLFLFLFCVGAFLLNIYQKNELTILILNFFFIIFFLGLIDDKKNLNANLKLIYSFLIITFFLISQPEYQVKSLNIIFFNKLIYIEKYSIVFTALCILLLFNALNMSDGINGLFLGNVIIFFSYLAFNYKNLNYLIILIIIILIICFFLNLLNKFFMGESGVMSIAFLLSVEIIKAYNYEDTNIKSIEQIFLTLMIPGIDMFKLFCIRIYNKKNPFKADNNHIHHIIKYATNEKFSLIICLLLSLIPIITFELNILNIKNAIFLGIILYFFTIILFKKNTK